MRSSLRIASMLALVLATAAVMPVQAADSEKKAFVLSWQGRPVVLKRTLFSVVYDERPRFAPLARQEGKVTGLTVATPSSIYYQFDARRDSEDDIIARDPNTIVTMLREQYRRSTHLEIGNVKDVEPVLLVRYEPGVQLIVKKVQIDRDRVRLMLHKNTGETATTLTVKWPAPLTKDLTESAVIDDVLGNFLIRN